MSKKEKENNSDKESLKAKYRDIDAQLLKAKESIERLETERSLIIKQIVEVMGTKGPFTFDGRQVTAVCRCEKTEKGKNGKPVQGGWETWFFKGSREKVTEL
jgi:uncharacterized protein (UPF0335 family)